MPTEEYTADENPIQGQIGLSNRVEVDQSVAEAGGYIDTTSWEDAINSAYMSAAEALQHVKAKLETNDESNAKQALLARARTTHLISGNQQCYLRTLAKSLTIKGNPLSHNPIAISESDRSLTDYELPKEFWGDGLQGQNWPVGDFSAWVTHGDLSGGKFSPLNVAPHFWQALGVRFHRDDLLLEFPLKLKVRATISAETNCETWLLQAFSGDPERRKSKEWFRDQAVTYFEGKLSKRGFGRVWAKIAPQNGRNQAGAKSKR